MKRKFRFSGVCLAILAAAVVSGGCTGQNEAGQVYLLNFKPEIDQQWKQAASLFTGETGIPMKVVTAASGTYEQTLRAQIDTSKAPTLFNINGPVGYQNFKDYTADLSGTEVYRWLSDKGLAINVDGGVYGIPYAVESYGIIYNDAILRKYIALPNKATSITRAGDINNFAVLKAVVEDIQRNKTALGIDGAFASTSFSPGEDWRWQTHLMNVPLYYEYRDSKVNDEAAISFEYAPQMKNLFDLYINNSVTDKNMLGNKTVGDSMAEFALGKAAFVQNGIWGWSQIANESGNVVQAADVKFLPLYTGVDGEENQGLCTGTENFIALNSKARPQDREASLKLLEWLFNSPSGKKAAVESLGFVAPFTTFTNDEIPDDPLVKEMMRYTNTAGLYSVTWVFVTMPSQSWKDALGQDLVQYAQGKLDWNELTRNAIAKWASEKAAMQ
jgi:raffinose/stachyose/melibiose transport system substrate-binding protein